MTDVYPPGYGVVIARGAIDFGIRWKAGFVCKEGVRYFVADAKTGAETEFNPHWRGVSIRAYDLSGLPVCDTLPSVPRQARSI